MDTRTDTHTWVNLELTTRGGSANKTLVIYADDNTPSCAANTLENLESETKYIAKKSVDWFLKNDMVVSSEKTKLLMIGSAKNRRNKIPDNYEPWIELEDEKIKLSTSEKLLGIVINNTMEWNHHIYGNEEELGLLRTLSKRIGFLSKIRKFV